MSLIAPSLRDDAAFHQWWQRASQRGAGPANARTLLRENVRADLRSRLADLQVPTLVLHRAGNRFIPRRFGRYLGEHVAAARYVELAGADHLAWVGDADALTDEIEDFLTGARGGAVDRMLLTLLFTDIVDSTGRAVALGDRERRAVLDHHDVLVREQLARYGGREVKTTGDGFFGSFAAPTQAVRCARGIVTIGRRARARRARQRAHR